jgi:FAD synthase
VIAIFTGTVQRGAGRGVSLGYPTVNISISESLLAGIYAGYVVYNEKRYQAAIFYGAAETFNATTPQLEAYMLDFSKNIYGETVSIELQQKIRDSKKFNSTQELTSAIEEDIKNIRACLQV